jgi:hypothetical protein
MFHARLCRRQLLAPGVTYPIERGERHVVVQPPDYYATHSNGTMPAT